MATVPFENALGQIIQVEAGADGQSPVNPNTNPPVQAKAPWVEARSEQVPEEPQTDGSRPFAMTGTLTFTEGDVRVSESSGVFVPDEAGSLILALTQVPDPEAVYEGPEALSIGGGMPVWGHAFVVSGAEGMGLPDGSYFLTPAFTNSGVAMRGDEYYSRWSGGEAVAPQATIDYLTSNGITAEFLGWAIVCEDPTEITLGS